ncbi:hypothetical protein [Mucilaginibacter aquariorum]|uniref:Lipoprotein n=1 Tax=Mucilaginibacter aquariorum TaxID=2967225 RepID=A0ABT1T142_9SPHI|nr:hypothetical protein [Mucilaginibacter aquariorum]MCQ6958316.1 hypothetical protein [Mucilaginibacter aquariorum]
MKTLKFLIIAGFALLIAGCGGSKNPELTGVYVNNAESEYSVATDTLIITAVNLATKTYSIERRDAFQRKRNGQKLPAEFRKETWQAVWNTDQQVLAETELGRQIYLSDDPKGVKLKNSVFLKIK